MRRTIAILLAGSVIFWSAGSRAEVRIETGFVGGLAFLARQQSDDGAFAGGDQRFRDTATTLLAFLSAGEVADVGRYGLTVRRAVEFLLSASPPDAGYGALDNSGMRGHAIVTLSLIEAFTVELDALQRQRLRSAVTAAVSALVRAQVSGGWTNAPGAAPDVGTTTWALLALTAAERIGIATDARQLESTKGFVAQVISAAQPGSIDAKLVVSAKATGIATTRPSTQPQLTYEDSFFLNFASLDAVALRQRDVRLLGVQQADGGWSSEPARGESRMYTTSLSVLALTVSMENLKTLQNLGQQH